MTQPTVFISYSHLDEREKDQLLTHLGIFQSHGLIGLWSDDRISGGGDWEADIEQAMAKAKVAILLVSANFLNSKFILSREVPRILQRRRDEGLIVFPVIAKPCAWQNITWLAKMNVRPKNGTPVWRQGGAYADEELAKIATEVYKLAKKSDSTLPPVAPGADLDQYMTPATSPRPVDSPQGQLVSALAQWQKEIEAKIDALNALDDDEKSDLKEKVGRVREEAVKGEAANPGKLERLLNSIAIMAPDILEVTAKTLQNPFAGVGLVLEKIGDRARLEKK